MQKSIADRIMDLIADKAMLDRSQVSPEASLADLGLDSLLVVELIFAIEEAFGIEVPFNANDPENSEFDVKTVASVAASVERLLQGDAAGQPA